MKKYFVILGLWLIGLTACAPISAKTTNAFSDQELDELTTMVNTVLDQIELPDGCVFGETYELRNFVDDRDDLRKWDLFMGREFIYPALDQFSNDCGYVMVMILSDYKQAQIEWFVQESANRMSIDIHGDDGQLITQFGATDSCNETDFCWAEASEMVNFRKLGEGLNLVIVYSVRMQGQVDLRDSIHNKVVGQRSNAIIKVGEDIDDLQKTFESKLTEWNKNRD